MDEQQLIKLARDGDREAFRSLFEDNKRRILSLAYHYLKNLEDAEDVLQETFIKAFQFLPRYKTEEGMSFSSWICRIGINASIDTLRKSKTRVSKSMEMSHLLNNSSGTEHSNPEQTTSNREVREKINQTLNRLSPRQRMIFILRHYQQFSTREIAEYLNSSEGSVKKHLFRAVQAMKEQLRDFLLEYDYGLQKI